MKIQGKEQLIHQRWVRKKREKGVMSEVRSPRVCRVLSSGEPIFLAEGNTNKLTDTGQPWNGASLPFLESWCQRHVEQSSSIRGWGSPLGPHTGKDLYAG